jgi:hypothetical protein
MTIMRVHQSHGRKLIFLLVLLSHCGLIFVLSRSSTRPEFAAPIPHEPLIVFLLESLEARTGATAAKEPTAAKTRTELRRPSTAPPTNLPPQSEQDNSSSNAITDWYAEAHGAAENAVEKERNKATRRTFEHKMPTVEEREQPSIFDPAPVRRAGTWDGPDRFYVTDNCYYEYDRAPRPPPTALDNRLKTPVCKPPPKGGGDAMFKDLVPDYLKTLPEAKSP